MSNEQWTQYQEFLAGDKSLCVIELRKDAYTYAIVVNHIHQHHEHHLHAWHSPEGAELVLARDYRTIANYLKLLHNEQQWNYKSGAVDARIQLGRAFGYDRESIAAFVRDWTPDYCQCSKCVGVHKAKEVLNNE